MRRQVQKHVDSQEDVRKLRMSSGYHRGTKSRDVAYAQAFLTWQDEILWTVNDFRDIEALCVAVVYADVVVTEKSWADMIRRSGLDLRFDTTVLSSVTELPELLVTSTRPE